MALGGRKHECQAGLSGEIAGNRGQRTRGTAAVRNAEEGTTVDDINPAFPL